MIEEVGGALVLLAVRRNNLAEPQLFFFSSRRRHTRSLCGWSSDVCSSDLFQSTKTLMLSGDTFFNSGSVTLSTGKIFLATNTTNDGGGTFLMNSSNSQLTSPLMHFTLSRSEERRVGKERTSRTARYHRNIK